MPELSYWFVLTPRTALMERSWPAQDVLSLLALIDDERNVISADNTVKFTEEQARAESDDVGFGRTWFSGNARARISGSTDGLLKLVFRKSDRQLLGAHILGEEATELIHIAQAVLHRGGAIDEFINTTFNFPTRADAFKYAAYDGLPPRASTLTPRQAVTVGTDTVDSVTVDE